MKRFVILLLILIALTATQGATEAAKKEVCVCANGEKNCPCLAESDPGLQLSGQVQLGDSQFHVSASPQTLKFRMRQSKVPHRPRTSRFTHVKKVRIYGKPRFIYKHIPLKFKYKAIAPQERKQLIVLKMKLRMIKRKMRLLRVASHKASLVQRREMIVKRQLYKRSRVGLKRQIKMLKAKLHTLVKQHFDKCVKQTIARAHAAVLLVTKLKKEIHLLTKKKEQLKNLIRVSPEPQSAALCTELKKLKVVIRHKKNKMLIAKKFILKVHAARKKAWAKKLARSVRRKDRKLNHLLLRYKKVAAKIALLKKRQGILKAKILAQKSTLREGQLSPHERLTIKLHIKQKTAHMLRILNKRKDLVVVKLRLRKRIQPLTIMVTKARRAMKKIKASNTCLGLQMKLSRELLKVKKLNAKFDRECSKALKSKSKEDIKKALHVRIKINAVKSAITKIKGHIRRVPLQKRHELKAKEEKLLVKLHMLQIDLKKAKAKASSVKLKCESATGDLREGLEKKRVVLLDKIVRIKHQIIDTKKGILILQTTHKQNCEDAIVKERKRSKEIILNIKNKLVLARKQADSLQKALEATRKLVELKATADRLKREELHTEDHVLQAQLRRRRAELKVQIVGLRRVEISAKLKAKRLQQELDQKSKTQLKAEQAVAKKKEEEIEAQMQDSIAKEEALRNALTKAHDEATIEALKKQRAEELRRLNALNIQLKESQEEQRALELEAQLLMKMELERKEEARLQRAIVLKNMRKKALKLKAEFDVKAASRKTVRITTLKAALLAKLQALQTKLLTAQRDFETYSATMKASGKKRIAGVILALRGKYHKKVKALEEAIKKERATQHAYKIKMMKATSDRVMELMKKLHDDSKAKLMVYKKKIMAATAKGKALIASAKLKSRVDISKLQAAAKKRMLILSGKIHVIQTQFAKAEDALNAQLLAQQKRKSGLTSDIAMEKTKAVQRKKAHKAWLVTQKTNIEQLLSTEKKASTQELSTVKAKISKVQAKNKQEEANLSAKLKTALVEIDNQKKSLVLEISNYKKLKADMKAWTIKQNLKLKSDVQREVTVRQAQATTMETKLKLCRTGITNTKAEQLRLEGEIEQKSSMIEEIHETAKRQAKAKSVIVELEGKLMTSTGQVLQLQKTIAETCDGSDGTEATCQEFRSSLSLIMQKGSDLQALLTEEREKFFKLH